MVVNMDETQDLEIRRRFSAPPQKVWRCWTDPDLFRQWWVPEPVTIQRAELDLRPGGRFWWVADIPGHGEMEQDFCFLDVVPGERIVFTDLMRAGWRPAKPMFGFTAVIAMTAQDGGTAYSARAMHQTPEGRRRHADMGFTEGWGAVADQLGRLAERI